MKEDRVYYGLIAEERYYGAGAGFSWREWVGIYLTVQEREFAFQEMVRSPEYKNFRGVIFKEIRKEEK